MGRKKDDLTGKRFGRLTVLSFSHTNHHKDVYWNCLCICGNKRSVLAGNLRRGTSSSCGCLRGELQAKRLTTHGMKGTPAHACWSNMKNRCLNNKNMYFKNYGGRGITVCNKWLRFEGFYEDMGDPPKGRSLDRIDNNKGYSKSNCRWATNKEQSNNTRSTEIYKYKGSYISISQLSRELGINMKTLYYRLKVARWSFEKAISTTVRPKRR